MVLLIAVAALVLIGSSYGRGDGSDPAGSTPTTEAPPAAEPTATHGTAAEALEKLTVKGRAPQTGYSRERFGRSWRDLDRNGCDQRNDVLRRDLRDITLKAGTDGCLVLSGTLTSPYSGEVVEFVRGTTTSRTVQIDHVVALSDAWQKGAQQWSAARREQFANDVLELRATDMHTNASKGSGDAATWLPPRKAFRCGYVARQIAVKSAYGLWVTPAERDAMRRVLVRCPRQGLPRRYAVPLGGGPELEAAGLGGARTLDG
nr:HNH endonuclease family protein [Aeromicrobium chenweiae]